jgi:hypothetical protein
MEYVCLLPHARHSKDLYSNENERFLKLGNIDLPQTHMCTPTTAEDERSVCMIVGIGFIYSLPDGPFSLRRRRSLGSPLELR